MPNGFSKIFQRLFYFYGDLYILSYNWDHNSKER